MILNKNSSQQPLDQTINPCPNCGSFTCGGVLESCEDYYVVCIKDTSETIFELAAEVKQDATKEVEVRKQIEAGNSDADTKREHEVDRARVTGEVEGKEESAEIKGEPTSTSPAPSRHERNLGEQKESEDREKVKAQDREAEAAWEDEVWDRAAKAWKSNKGYMEIFGIYCSLENQTKGQD